MYVASIDMPDPRQDPQTVAGPKITVENIRASAPYRFPKDSNVHSDESILFDASSYFLSHLVIIPTSDNEKALQLPPTIMAFYTPMVDAMGMVSDGQLSMTTVRRWHVISAESKLHVNFDSIQSKASSTSLNRRSDLRRLEDVHINQIITTVQKMDGGEQLALGCADGSLALYDPHSLAPLYITNDSNDITSLAATGFTFPSFSRGLNLTISPNACLSASLASDGKMQLTHVEHPSGLTYDSTDTAIIEAAIAALILTFARSFYSSVSWHDIILLVTQHLDPLHHPQLIQSISKDLLGDKDFILSPELTNSTSKPFVARILGLTASLGHDPATDQRSQSSMLSWLSLHMRSSALHLYRILTSVSQNGGIEWKDPEVCEIVCNNIRWTLDLCKFIVDDLFEMVDHNDTTSDKESHHQPGHSTGITQLLLLSIWPRSFLKMITRVLRGFLRAIQDPKTTLSSEAAPAFARMADLIDTSPLKMESLEQLLSGVDKTVQHFHQVAGMSDRDKADTERFILSHGQIPEVLQDVVPRILQNVLPMTRPKIDRLSLYMEDYSWLGVRDDQKTKVFKRDFVVDVHRKKVMKRKGLGKVRKCVRCGSISADLLKMRHWPQLLQTQFSRCVCEDVFAVVGPDGI